MNFLEKEKGGKKSNKRWRGIFCILNPSPPAWHLCASHLKLNMQPDGVFRSGSPIYSFNSCTISLVVFFFVALEPK